MSDVIKQICGFYINSVYYGDTDFLYIHKRDWSNMVENSYVCKSLGLEKSDSGNSGIFHERFLAPEINYCLVIDHFDVISAKGTYKEFSEEHRLIEFNEFTSLSERKTISGRFSLDWTKSHLETEKPHRKQDCFECKNKKQFVKIVLKDLN